MNKYAPWLSLGMLLTGCQTTASPKFTASGMQEPGPGVNFEQQAVRLTEDGGELVLSEFHADQDRKVALIIRYSERSESGKHCTLSIIEQTEEEIVVVESTNQVMSCSGMSVPNANAVRGGLEATLKSDFIRLDEDRIRNRSEYEFERARDGRWHLAYSADIGPEHDAATGDLLVVSYAVAYRNALGPTVSEVDSKAIGQARERSVY